MNYLFDKKAVLFSSIILLLVVGCTPGVIGNPTATPPPVSTAIPSTTVNELHPIAQKETQTPVPTTVPPIVTGKIVASDTVVNVRSGPGTTYDRIGTLPGGTKVQVTGRSPQKDWWRVSADGIEGWMFSGLVIVEGDAQAVPCIAGADGNYTTVETPSGNDQAIASIRAMIGVQDLPIFFLREDGNPNADLRKTLIYADEKGGEYWVDKKALQIVYWMPGQTENSGDVKTIDTLRSTARTFAERQSPMFRQTDSSLTFTESTKDGSAYAFRWDDQSLTGHTLFPFIQILIRTDGQIINFYNILDILEK
jgi:SH3-like domain-containing protein